MPDQIKSVWEEHGTKILVTLLIGLVGWLINQTNSNHQEIRLIQQSLHRMEVTIDKVEDTRFTNRDGERLKLELEAMVSKCNCKN